MIKSIVNLDKTVVFKPSINKKAKINSDINTTELS